MTSELPRSEAGEGSCAHTASQSQPCSPAECSPALRSSSDNHHDQHNHSGWAKPADNLNTLYNAFNA